MLTSTLPLGLGVSVKIDHIRSGVARIERAAAKLFIATPSVGAGRPRINAFEMGEAQVHRGILSRRVVTSIADEAHMTSRSVAVAVALAATTGCSEPNEPGAATSTIQLVFMGSTTRRTDLPASAQACVNGVGSTHTHPSWRAFAAFPLQPGPPDRYEITFTDVPVDTPVSLRVNDQNACDENPTGAVTRNVFVNGARLVQNTTTPGSGDEPGFAFSITPTGAIRQ